ncbi:MAG: GC-type dockerin domain-anchored protein [Planctomycetota bacterium]
MRRAITLVPVLTAYTIASAQTPAVNFTQVAGGFRDNNARVLGWDFTVGELPIEITALGVYDADQNGLAVVHDVAIYEVDTMNSVIGATVNSGPGGAPLVGFFRYSGTLSVQLPPHTSYIIAASWPGTADEFIWHVPFPNVPAHPLDIDITEDIERGIQGAPGIAWFECCTTSALQFPTQVLDPTDIRNIWLGPNFLYRLVRPCNAADVALPFELVDLADIDAFIAAFVAGEDLADIAAPMGVVDLADIDAFISAFLAGCP